MLWLGHYFCGITENIGRLIFIISKPSFVCFRIISTLTTGILFYEAQLLKRGLGLVFLFEAAPTSTLSTLGRLKTRCLWKFNKPVLMLSESNCPVIIIIVISQLFASLTSKATSERLKKLCKEAESSTEARCCLPATSPATDLGTAYSADYRAPNLQRAQPVSIACCSIWFSRIPIPTYSTYVPVYSLASL